jgi:hypothetical protein
MAQRNPHSYTDPRQLAGTRSKSISRSFRERSSRPRLLISARNSNSACLPFSPITSAWHRPSTGPSLAAISILFWPKSPSNGWFPQPDGIRHRNSEREYLVSGMTEAVKATLAGVSRHLSNWLRIALLNLSQTSTRSSARWDITPNSAVSPFSSPPGRIRLTPNRGFHNEMLGFPRSRSRTERIV